MIKRWRWKIFLLLGLLTSFVLLIKLNTSKSPKPHSSRRSSLSKFYYLDRAPFEYPDEVDFRIIVLTHARPQVLEYSLLALNSLVDTKDVRVALEIWIDRKVDGSVDQETLQVAEEFKFDLGQKRVHVQEIHVNTFGQWVDTWRPRENSTEVGLILEDDIVVSPFVWRFLMMVNRKYGSNPDCAGYSLQTEGVQIAAKWGTLLSAPAQDAVLLYQLYGTWGFAPKPNHWRKFQDFFHGAIQDPNFRPYVPDVIMTDWYKGFEMEGREDTMWDMFYVYFSYHQYIFHIYPNPAMFDWGNFLAVHRAADGLHYSDQQKTDQEVEDALMETWPPSFKLPNHVKTYDFYGRLVKKQRFRLD